MSAARLRLALRVGSGRPQSRLPGFLVGSLIAHVGFAAAMLAFPALRPPPPPMEPSIEVVMLPGPPLPAPVKAAPAPQPRPAEPEPEPPPKEEVQAAPKDPDPAPVEVKPQRKPKKVESKRKSKPTPKPRRETAPAPPSAGGQQMDPDTAEGISGGGAVALEGMSAEFNWYRDAVVRALYSSWRQPFLASNRDPLEAMVEFQILRDGTVRSVRLTQQSGYPALDRSALRAVQEASLPPLPRNYRKPVQPARFLFRLFPES